MRPNWYVLLSLSVWSDACHSSTPPYVTARPEVVTTDLLPAPTEKNLAQPRKRFIVMATDGLWDRLENDTVYVLRHLLFGN
jgi:serine/threonine protein phosphatase PrpC